MLLIKLRLYIFQLLEKVLSLFSYRVCKKCKSKIQEKYLFICKDCIRAQSAWINLKSFQDFDSKLKIYFLFRYSDKLIRKLILDLKNNQAELAYFWGLALSEFLIYLFNSKINRNIYISYVPISTEKFNTRRYNQAELIAKYFYKFLRKRKFKQEIKLVENLFYRIKNTEPLYKLNSEERRNELSKAFELNPKYIPLIKNISEKRENIILIIDDISTTGNTLVKLSELITAIDFPQERILGFSCTGRNFN